MQGRVADLVGRIHLGAEIEHYLHGLKRFILGPATDAENLPFARRRQQGGRPLVGCRAYVSPRVDEKAYRLYIERGCRKQERRRADDIDPLVAASARPS